MDQKHAGGIYSIGAVSRMLDLPPATIRNWEDRYGMVSPERSDGGHRLYSREDLERISFVAAQVGTGIQPADAHRLLAERLDERGSVEREPQSHSILLVDRESASTSLTHFFLETENYRVLTATAPDEAANSWSQERPEIAIVDLTLPGSEGIQLCERLTGERSGSLIAISPLELREAALAAGADAFLRKPIDPLELVSVVRDLLGASAIRYEGSTNDR